MTGGVQAVTVMPARPPSARASLDSLTGPATRPRGTAAGVAAVGGAHPRNRRGS